MSTLISQRSHVLSCDDWGFRGCFRGWTGCGYSRREWYGRRASSYSSSRSDPHCRSHDPHCRSHDPHCRLHDPHCCSHDPYLPYPQQRLELTENFSDFQCDVALLIYVDYRPDHHEHCLCFRYLDCYYSLLFSRRRPRRLAPRDYLRAIWCTGHEM